MSGPGEEWNEAAAVQDWDNAMARASMRQAEQQGTAGERAGAAYSEPAGRPRQRGVRRRSRDATMDAVVVERVEQLAGQQHGGNYSAALQAVVEAGLATMDAAARMAAAGVELDQLTSRRAEIPGPGSRSYCECCGILVSDEVCPVCCHAADEDHGPECSHSPYSVTEDGSD